MAASLEKQQLCINSTNTDNNQSKKEIKQLRHKQNFDVSLFCLREEHYVRKVNIFGTKSRASNKT